MFNLDIKMLFFAFSVLLLCQGIRSYKPVFLIHGIYANNDSLVQLGEIIKKHHPGTKIYIPSNYNLVDTLLPMEAQKLMLTFDFIEASVFHQHEGFHLIGYSQGGLVARSLLESFSFHNVHNFISLSSPQAGQFGVEIIRPIFPKLEKEIVWQVLYAEYLQTKFAVSNYWNDPNQHNEYLNNCTFLTKINNEIPHKMNKLFKRGITKLKNLVLIGGPDDGIIEPWQSSQFGFYDENKKVVPVNERSIYKEDLIGLKTLDERKALHSYSIPGVKHGDWPSNSDVIEKYILPWLD